MTVVTWVSITLNVLFVMAWLLARLDDSSGGYAVHESETSGHISI